MKRAIFLILGAVLFAPAAAQGRTVFFTEYCGDSTYEPEEIVLTCADHAVFIKSPTWEAWGENEATTLATLVYPDPSCRVVICPRDEEDEVRVNLWRVVPCPSSGSWQFTRMRLKDLDGELPRGVPARRSYSCSDFAPYRPPPPPPWRTCAPPPDTLFYSLKVRGVSCATGRRVLTHGRCLSTNCARTRWGPWRCRTGRGISDRAKFCHRGKKRVVGRASGD